MSLTIAPAYDAPQEIGALFAEYTEMLIQSSPGFRQYLELQNYEDELQHLEAKYGGPDGRLYLARWNGAAAGCIGLRLYVRPAFRGRKIGNALAERTIADARAIGYRHMLLDTFPFLRAAISMYQGFGFYEIPSYNNSPMNDLLYMQLDLSI